MTGYYRRFVKRFFLFLVSFDQVNSKDSQVSMVGSCEKSFLELKKRRTTTLVLTLREGTQYFVVFSDASGVCSSCLLMKNGKVISYAS